ncbi:GlsB/YeaQ/YmgE family stress response membrane protein [Sphingomonas sp. RT2P30]|uniref:GlsB/YeaQ/YmgE family stress response membrane protein n=1 Tax=Parasphingomonas halimpatiens TaxID=3096162 RepID=UPI002FC71533
MFHVIRMFIVGAIVGILARWVYPGAIHMGLFMSALLGIGGSFVGGLIGRLLSPGSADQPLHPAGFVMSIIGAMLLIFVAHLLHIG